MWKLCLLFLTLAACGDNIQTQLITGRVGASYPNPITSVEVLTSGRPVATSAVATDGSFVLLVHPGRGLSLHLVSAAGHSTTVFPRIGGSIDRSFDVRGSGVPFDLGTLHYINAASTTAFVFKTAAEQAMTCDGEGEDAGGAQCVDDGDNQAGACDEEDGDNNQEGENETEDGETEDNGAANEDQNGPDEGDSVADHNFPEDGCADGNDNGGDDDHQDEGDGE